MLKRIVSGVNEILFVYLLFSPLPPNFFIIFNQSNFNTSVLLRIISKDFSLNKFLSLSSASVIVIDRSAPTRSAVGSRLNSRPCHKRSEPFKNEMPMSILPSGRAYVDSICADFTRNWRILELELVVATTTSRSWFFYLFIDRAITIAVKLFW